MPSASSASTLPYRVKYPLPTLSPFNGLSVCANMPPYADMQLMQAAGIKWFRTDVSWGTVEYVAGQYDFSQYDQLLTNAQLCGLRINFDLTGGNPLYTGASNALPSTSTQLAAFGKFVWQFVNHFKHQGILWEETNEPDLNCTFSQFQQIHAQVAWNLRVASPDEWYAGPAISTISRDISINFLTQCLQAGMLNDWDAVVVHTYYYNSEPETEGPLMTSTQALIQSYAAPGRLVPLLAGEWGYSDPNTPLQVAPSTYSTTAPNVLTNSNTFSASNWGGYWTKPALTSGVADPFGGANAWRCASTDASPSTGNYFSGLVQNGPSVFGAWYTVSVWLRSEGAPFPVFFGLEDKNTGAIMVDGTWRRYNFTFQCQNYYSELRFFELFERTQNNPAFDIYGAQTEVVTNLTSSLIASSKLATECDYLPRMYLTCVQHNIPYLAIYNWREDPKNPGFGLLDAYGNPTAKYYAVKNFFLGQ